MVRRCARSRRGTAYILVLGVSMMVSATALAVIASVRIERRAGAGQSDLGQARLNAMAALDRALLIVHENPFSWRAALESAQTTGYSLDHGEYDLLAVREIGIDPSNPQGEAMRVKGVGRMGGARSMIEIIIDPNGEVLPGSWRRLAE